MKFAFGTVFHPKILRFVPEFVQSLLNQTDKNFHVFIINDGCNVNDIDLTGLDYTFLSPGETIIENRVRLISEIYNRQYEWIIFGDADDYFDNNRVEIIRNFTDHYDLIANEIVPFEGLKTAEPIIHLRLGNFSTIEKDFIRNKNIFGFSNTACRTSYLNNISIPKEIIAVDWYLFSKVMESGANACFTAKTNSFYRQWEENIIGANKKTKKHIETGVKAKYFHYKNMKNGQDSYSDELEWLKKIYNHIDGQDFDHYADKILRQEEDSAFWWENIKNYKDE